MNPEETPKKTRGNFGNPEQHRLAGQLGGEKVVQLFGANHMAEIGRKGGKVSGGNFKNNRKRASEAGQKGGLTKKKGEDATS